jgi:hypothetical protein
VGKGFEVFFGEEVEDFGANLISDEYIVKDDVELCF